MYVSLIVKDLVDVWRIVNPDSRRYTWRRKKSEIHCQLDFFLASQSTICDVKSATIATGYRTDHSLIDLKVALHSNPRGPGY